MFVWFGWVDLGLAVSTGAGVWVFGLGCRFG